jgi:hypothetical protein
MAAQQHDDASASRERDKAEEIVPMIDLAQH